MPSKEDVLIRLAKTASREAEEEEFWSVISPRANAREAMADPRVSLGSRWRTEAEFKSAKTRELVSGRLPPHGRRQAFGGPRLRPESSLRPHRAERATLQIKYG